MSSKPLAVIVGSGISGLSAAYWLDKAGWQSLIIERAPAVREGGYMIGLTGLGVETAKHMHLCDQLDTIRYDLNENVFYTASGRELMRMKHTDAHGPNSIALTRGDLATTLLHKLPDTATIRFGETVADFVDQGDHVDVTLQKSGETIRADLLIGADGLHSSLRDKLFKGGPSPLYDLGYSFAVYDVCVESQEEGGEEESETTKVNLPCDCVSYTRPGHLDFFYQLRNHRVAAMHLWRDSDDSDKLPPLRNESGTHAYDRLRALAQGGNPEIHEMIQRAETAGAPVLLDKLTMVKLPTWSQGRVLLLGDSAHCLTLMSGQGAAMAMGSAEILSQELQATKNNDVLAALANHEKRLRPAIVRLQNHSESLAAAYIPKNVLVYYLRNLLLQLVPYKWLIAWHVKKIEDEVKLTTI